MKTNSSAPFKIILASGSPRRQQYFKELGLEVEIRLKPVEEVYPPHLTGHKIPDYLAQLKATVFKNTLLPNEILITSDTVVWHKNKALGKPANKKEATAMLQSLSGDWHQVISSVSFTTSNSQKTVNHTTKVKFGKLKDQEIDYYIDAYKPYDKAGGYGIQEWIGLIGIEGIQGSYANVVGLPTHLVYTVLGELMGDTLVDNIKKVNHHAGT